ncbi:MAG: hypothetical protein U5L72_09320 [Bacteroidales bacterium]|nr:hypothetical protein [Bacteroidales bacterium]
MKDYFQYSHEVIEMTAPTARLTPFRRHFGTSRGEQDVEKMVDTLEILNSRSGFFCIGGDGTLRQADVIDRRDTRRNLKNLGRLYWKL